jgi:hypothetical protein
VTVAERSANRFDRPVDGFADGRFGPGEAVHRFFGRLGDAGFAEGAACRFVDPGDPAVDGTGYRPGRGLTRALGFSTAA